MTVEILSILCNLVVSSLTARSFERVLHVCSPLTHSNTDAHVISEAQLHVDEFYNVFYRWRCSPLTSLGHVLALMISRWSYRALACVFVITCLISGSHARVYAIACK